MKALVKQVRDSLRAFTKLSGHLRQTVNQKSYFSEGGGIT